MKNRAYGGKVELTQTPPTSMDESGYGSIGPLHNPYEVRELTLVLSSMQVPFLVREQRDAWLILVPHKQLPRALSQIGLYRNENRDWPPRRAKEILPYARSFAAPLVLLSLVLFYAVIGPGTPHSTWASHGAAVSERILHGELWRAVTALTLHADATHIVGNAFSGTIFLSAVNRRLGNGRGSFYVVAAGSLGNVLNAVWHHAGHISIGASTAVFAAVGILVSTQLAVDRHMGPRSLLERVAPVMGGLALLGTLGASPHSDLFAHLFGFLAGAVLGLPFIVRRRPLQPTSALLQVALGLLTAAIVIGSWAAAFVVKT